MMEMKLTKLLIIEEGALKLTLINLWGNWGVRGY